MEEREAELKKVVILVALALTLGSPACHSQSLAFNEVAPNFGVTPQGERSAAKIISVSNQDFSQTNNCPMWLAEDSACLVFVTFTPTVPGARTGELTMVPTEGHEQSISLKGFGLSPKDMPSGTLPAQSPSGRTTNNEEKAQELLNDKQFTFQNLLDKKPAEIANIKRVFALSCDTPLKLRSASILLSIGEKDATYFDYLSTHAKNALAHDHDIPWPSLYDEHGESTTPNPVFAEWCNKHDLRFWDMYRVSYYELPSSWYFLGAAGDPRFYELLVSGLHSPNLMLAAAAARGLAKLQDPRAVKELIATGSRVPGEALLGIVQALIYFPSPEAQEAADRLVPEKEKSGLEFYRQEMQKRGFKALFQW